MGWRERRGLEGGRGRGITYERGEGGDGFETVSEEVLGRGFLIGGFSRGMNRDRTGVCRGGAGGPRFREAICDWPQRLAEVAVWRASFPLAKEASLRASERACRGPRLESEFPIGLKVAAALLHGAFAGGVCYWSETRGFKTPGRSRKSQGLFQGEDYPKYCI